MTNIFATVSADEDLMISVWCEIAEALMPHTEWWETEGLWEDAENLLNEMGFNADMTLDFFSEMAWDL